MTTRSLWGRVFVGGSIREQMLITIEDGQIGEIREFAQAPADATRISDLIVPGFVDVHVHGGDGADFMDGSDEAVARVAAFHARNGTTALAATTLSGSREAIRDAVAAIARVAPLRPPDAAEICASGTSRPAVTARRSSRTPIGFCCATRNSGDACRTSAASATSRTFRPARVQRMSSHSTPARETW